MSSVEETIEQEDESKDQGQNGKNENGTLKKKTGKRGRKANTNHKENNTQSNSTNVTNSKSNAHLATSSFTGDQSINGCANNTRSKCRKSRSGRSIRNSKRLLSSLNYNENSDNELDDKDANSENSVNNKVGHNQLKSAYKTRRNKRTKLNDTNEINQTTAKNQLIDNRNMTYQTPKDCKTMTNHSLMYLEKNDENDEIKLNNIMNNRLQFTELNSQRQINTVNVDSQQQQQQSTMNKQLRNDKLNSNNNKSNFINNHLFDNSLSCAMNECTMTTLQQPQQQHNLHSNNNDYIISNESFNENNLNFMQQMHPYSLPPPTNDLNGKEFNCKTAYMQGLNETSNQITSNNNVIISTENTLNDQNTAIKSDQDEYEEDLDEIQRASLVLTDSSIDQQQHKNSSILYLNNLTAIDSNGNSIYGQQSNCCSIGSINASSTETIDTMNSNRETIHQQLLDNTVSTSNAATYTLCCPISAQSNIVQYNQCLNGSTTASVSFTQSNPLLASTSADSSTITSLTSMSPVQLDCQSTSNNSTNLHTNETNNSNGAATNGTSMIQVLTNTSNQSNIEIVDNLNGQSSTIIHYSPVHANLSHLTKSINANYSTNLNDHHLVQSDQMINQASNHHQLQSQITSTNSVNQEQINLISTTNTDHLSYQNTLDPTSTLNCSTNDILEQYHLEPMNNLLSLNKKTSFVEFEEQLKKENNLNNINNLNTHSLHPEKEIIYLLNSSNTPNLNFIMSKT